MSGEKDKQLVIEELGIMYSAAVRCKACPFRDSCRAQAKYPQRERDGHLLGCDEFIIKLAKERVEERLTGNS
jgi:hypothetical protein